MPGKARPGASIATRPLERLAVEQCHEGMALFDHDGRVVIWNDRLAEMTGRTARSCIGRPLAGALEQAGIADAGGVAAALSGIDVSPRRGELRSPDGRVVTVELMIRPVRDHASRVVGGSVLVGVVPDAAEVHRAVVESERIHRQRFTDSPDAILVLDRNGRYVDANPAVCRLTGYSHDELMTGSLGAIWFPGEHPSAAQWFAGLVASGVSRAERSIRHKDGTRVHVEVHAVAVDDGTYQVSIRDIAERRAAEERLYEALQRLRFHVDRMPLGYIGWSNEMVFVEWNPACERIFGWTAEEILGRRWDVLVPEHALGPVAEIIDRLLAGDTSSHSINENLRKDGTIITCEWFNTPLKDSEGRLSGAASMVHDVSQRQLAESQLREAQRLESLGVLTRGIAHDFGNLLTVIQGGLTLINRRRDTSHEVRAHLELVDGAARKAADLTDHLLAFSRTGRHNPQRSNLNDIIRNAMVLVRSSLAESVHVELQLDDAIREIEVDRGQIEQILLNLCINAAQAMPSGGAVTIATGPSRITAAEAARCMPMDQPAWGPRVELRVTDTGCGMDEAVIRRIFDPFFTTKTEGHGLGLSAVLGILKQHGAHVLTESSPRKGTTFRIFFPVEGRMVNGTPGSTRRTASAEEGAAPRRGRRRIGAGSARETSKRHVRKSPAQGARRNRRG
ncbi:MAG: PAS domain S-box protein [Phycisphaerales bacterium]|nr:PAS domain S-box protein [Phycisphaerales bacterium]